MPDINKLVEVVPSERQLEWQKMEFYGFIHYGPNTYLDLEWGDGRAPLSVFQPLDLDVEQWVISMKAAEMKGLIMVCKHHDGFCFWDTKTTDYKITNTVYKKDLIKELAAFCKKHKMKLGVYLSPWDRNHESYGSLEYNDVFIEQLDELLSNYGEVFSVWFDGACGEGANGKKQLYDWNRYYDLVRKKQPKAVISIVGPDVRWCGNEAGDHRPEEWSVVPERLKRAEQVASISQQEDDEDFRKKKLSSSMLDLGSKEALEGEEDLIWYPSEVDTSIRPGWFHTEKDDDKVRPLDELLNIYINSVGGNSCLLLNVPPGKEGYFKKNDVKRLNEIGIFIRETFKDNLLEDANLSVSSSDPGSDIENVRTDADDSFWRAEAGKDSAEILLELKSKKEFNYLVLMEEIRQSQRIEEFDISCFIDGEYKIIYRGRTVGYKKICHFDKISTDKLKITIHKSRLNPVLKFLGVYNGYQVNS